MPHPQDLLKKPDMESKVGGKYGGRRCANKQHVAFIAVCFFGLCMIVNMTSDIDQVVRKDEDKINRAPLLLSQRVAKRDMLEGNRDYSRTPEVKRVLITGAAGFIGSHVAITLMQPGNKLLPGAAPELVVGIDNFNDYYDVRLKEYRRGKLNKVGVQIVRGDVCNSTLVQSLFEKHRFTHVVHLAAQAGVRYSVTNPEAYITNNVMCTTRLLEVIQKRPAPLPTYIYASSSSVYGHTEEQPFSELQVLDQPGSLYAATKRSQEDLAYVYHHLYGIRCTGLRFFTVYGPMGRPDMAIWQWVDAAMQGTPIRLYEKKGAVLRRDFTYIEDIVDGVIKALYKSLAFDTFNLGKGQPETVLDLISYVETATHTKVTINAVPMPRADLVSTFSNVTHAYTLLQYAPKTPLKEGVQRYVEWYKTYKEYLAITYPGTL